MVATESQKSCLENIGLTVKPFNPEVQKKVIGDADGHYLPSCRPDS